MVRKTIQKGLQGGKDVVFRPKYSFNVCARLYKDGKPVSDLEEGLYGEYSVKIAKSNGKTSEYRVEDLAKRQNAFGTEPIKLVYLHKQKVFLVLLTTKAMDVEEYVRGSMESIAFHLGAELEWRATTVVAIVKLGLKHRHSLKSLSNPITTKGMNRPSVGSDFAMMQDSMERNGMKITGADMECRTWSVHIGKENDSSWHMVLYPDKVRVVASKSFSADAKRESYSKAAFSPSLRKQEIPAPDLTEGIINNAHSACKLLFESLSRSVGNTQNQEGSMDDHCSALLSLGSA